MRLDERGGTLADLGTGLRYKGIGCGVVLVASAGLGTLNTAALTAEALAARSLPLLGVVIGSWPDEPGLAEESNLVDLPAGDRGAAVGPHPPGGRPAAARRVPRRRARLVRPRLTCAITRLLHSARPPGASRSVPDSQ